MTLAERLDAALEALYEQVPDVGCKGLCSEYCGPVDGGARERARMARAGFSLPTREEHHGFVAIAMMDGSEDRVPMCAALGDDGRCQAYASRPMICRLWGASESLPCPHGCRPVDGRPLLTDEETTRLLRAATNLRLGVDT